MATNEPPDAPHAERYFKGLPIESFYQAQFLLDCSQHLKWGDLSHSTVMDVGCELISPILFETLFPNAYRVIFIDTNEFYIQCLQANETSPNMEYHVADITRRDSLTRWESQISNLVTFYCLNKVEDKRSALENIYYMLKPGGEAIILASLRNRYYCCARKLLDTPKWKPFQILQEKLPDHETHDNEINFYSKTLLELKFEVLLCTENYRRTLLSAAELLGRKMATNVPSDEPHLECLQGPTNETYYQVGFLLDCAKRLEWGDLSQSTVMVFGYEHESQELFKKIFPNVHRVIFLEIHESDRKETESSPNMEYRVADITRRDSLTRWESQISKIVSFFCFNEVGDKRSALENVYYMLKPGGQAIILVTLENPHYSCARKLLDTPKWKPYQNIQENFPDHENHASGIDFYTKILLELQFEVILCKENSKLTSLSTGEIFLDSALYVGDVVDDYIPSNVREEFKEDLETALMKEAEEFTPDGDPVIRTSTARIIVRKNTLTG